MSEAIQFATSSTLPHYAHQIGIERWTKFKAQQELRKQTLRYMAEQLDYEINGFAVGTRATKRGRSVLLTTDGAINVAKAKGGRFIFIGLLRECQGNPREATVVGEEHHVEVALAENFGDQPGDLPKTITLFFHSAAKAREFSRQVKAIISAMPNDSHNVNSDTEGSTTDSDME